MSIEVQRLRDRVEDLELEIKQVKTYLEQIQPSIKHNFDEIYNELSLITGKEYPEIEPTKE